MMTRRDLLVASAALLAAPQAAPKRIGFVDDDLDNFHARVYLEALRGPLKERGWVVTGATALQTEKSRAWAAKNNLEYFDTVAALDQVVDVYAILAPSTPKTHEELCGRVLPFGKTTFVDKTFAPDAAAAERIFKLADQHKVALQTTSALRYTAVQKFVASVGPKEIRHVVAWAPGGSYDEYAIHPLEMAISCLGPDVHSMMRRGPDDESQLLINFSEGRTAVVNVYVKKKTPYAAAVTTTKETRYFEVDTRPLFVDAAAGMLDFFAAGKERIDRRETTTIMRILDASRTPAAREGFVKL